MGITGEWDRRISRRTLLRTGGSAAAGLTLAGALSSTALARGPFEQTPFSLGVASGDPLPDGVVLWTRLAQQPLLPDGGMNPQPYGVRGFKEIANSDLIGNVPTVTVIMAAVFALAFCILRYTRFGVHVFAIGGDTDSARLSGVPVTRVRTLVYVLAGLAAGLAGVLLASASGSVAPFQGAGQNDLLAILAAVIIGGTALEGGRGTVIGTLVGVLLLGIISNGLVLENVSSFWQPVIVGTVLLLAIILDELRRRASLRVAT